ncbi:hypothetical protein [Yersinia phage PY100]|nr:hypothetical protein [Yersinia phage PY100]
MRTTQQIKQPRGNKLMSDMILPVGGSGVGAGAGVGAAVGGFLGAAVGDGGLLGGRGRGDGGALGVNLLQDSITGVRDAIGSLGLNVIQGQGSTNTTVERAVSSLAFAGANQANQNLLATVQGFAGLNTAIVQSGNQTVNAVTAANFAAERCCCETQKLIAAEACATRELIQANTLRQADHENTRLAQEVSNLKQNQYLEQRLQQMAGLIIGHIPRPTAAAAA